MSQEILLVNQIFPMINGILSHSTYDFTPCNKEELDLLFISNYGLRPVSPLVTNIISDNIANDEELTKISSMLVSIYSKKWDRLKSLVNLDYDPIHNYMDELTEEITGDGTENITSSKTKDFTNLATEEKLINGSNTSESSSSEDFTGTNTGNTSDGVFGFNSTKSVGSETSDTSENSTENNKKSGTSKSTSTFNNSNTLNETTTQTESGTNGVTSTMSRKRVSTHKGNIGNLTTQQLVKQEIEVWKWNFIETVLEDMKNFLTLPIYI